MKNSFKLFICMFAMVFAITSTCCAKEEKNEPTIPSDELEGYNVVFDTDGGSEIESAQVEKGKLITCPSDPMKEGYGFMGWYYGDHNWNFSEETVQQDMILTAKWVDISDYTFKGSSIDYIPWFEVVDVQIPNSYTKDGKFVEINDIYNGIIPLNVKKTELTEELQNIIIDINNKYFKVVDRKIYSKDGTTLLAVGGRNGYVWYEAELVVPENITMINGQVLNAFPLVKINIDNNKNFKKEEDALYTSDGKTLLLAFPLNEYVIPEGVTSIGDYAFNGRSSLTDLTFPSSLKTIGKQAFSGCTNVKTINIPEGVTSIGDFAFSNCANLENVILPNSLTDIGGFTFENCSKLTNIAIPRSVLNIGNSIFKGCTNLKNIYLEEGSYYQLKEGSLYSGDGETLIKYIGSGEVTADMLDGVKYIADSAFEGCDITSIIIPNTVVSIGNNAFENCKKLQSITISNSISSIGEYTFSGCSKLQNVTIPDTITSIGDFAFSNCANLQNVTIPDTITSIGMYAFSGCSKLQNVTIPEGVTSIELNTFSGCSKLQNIIIPRSVTNIDRYAFSGCGTLENLYYNGSIEDWCNFEFLEASYNNEHFFILNDGNVYEEVKELVIPENITSIGEYQFYGFKGLESIIIPESVETIGKYAFRYCNNLTGITILEGVTNIEENAFSNCSNLQSIIIPRSVETIGKNAFYYCKKLENVTIAEGVKNIGDSAFEDCESLTNITIPRSVTNIGEEAFSGCGTLENLYYNGSIEDWCNFEFLEASFNNEHFFILNDGNVYEEVKELVIPENITSIGEYQFYGFKGLQSIIIPESVETIGNCAFLECDNLTIYCKVESKPDGWDEYWNIYECPVIWGYEE